MEFIFVPIVHVVSQQFQVSRVFFNKSQIPYFFYSYPVVYQQHSWFCYKNTFLPKHSILITT